MLVVLLAVAGCSPKVQKPAETTARAARASPPPCPETPAPSDATRPPPTLLPESTEGHVIGGVRRVLAEAGHACLVDDKGLLVCDKDESQKPTLAILYTETSNLPRLVFGSSFAWKTRGACAKSVAKLNELNRSVDFIKAYCNEAAMTWSATLVVSPLGVRERDVAAFASWFAASVQVLLAESELVPSLR